MWALLGSAGRLCGSSAESPLLSPNSRMIALFDVPLAAFVGWLLWRSLEWPMVGDATFFHFIAVQMQMGALPYRDIVDIQMPLMYLIHAAIVATIGTSDVAWRVFDVAAATVMAGLILMLVCPAGRPAAILAVLLMLATHLLLGPYATGQRDYLMSIPILAAALASLRAVDHRERPRFFLFLVGAFAMTAASIKPSGILVAGLPALTSGGLRWRDAMWIIAGAAAVGLLVLVILIAWGALGPFRAMIWELWPIYAQLDMRSIPQILRDAALWLAPIGGLALAAALSLAAPKPPRVRLMIGLACFGLVHLLIQRKGYSYHVYPLGVGLACWGAWSLAALPRWRAGLCLAVVAATLVAEATRLDALLSPADPFPRAAASMQSALESRLPRGARVQTLDTDNGAFLAMVRAGMRQATRHIMYFPLILGGDSVRREFIAALEAHPPAAILLTNSQWPMALGFEATEQWPKFASVLASHYVLDRSGEEGYIAWRLYLRRTLPLDAPVH